MHRALVSFTAALLALTAAAATAAAQTPTATPPQVATGGQPLPTLAQGYFPGLNGTKPTTVPRGWTILSWDLSLAADTSTTLDSHCPSGAAIANFALAPTGGPLTILLSPADFVPLYGSNGSTLTATTAAPGQPGTLQLATMCAPSVKAKTTVVHGRSPVTFPNSEDGIGLKKGAVIPHTWRVYKSVMRKVGASGAVVRIAGNCPGDTQHNQHAVSQPRVGAMTLPSNGFTLGPSPKLAKGPVTVYTLCSSLNV